MPKSGMPLDMGWEVLSRGQEGGGERGAGYEPADSGGVVSSAWAEAEELVRDIGPEGAIEEVVRLRTVRLRTRVRGVTGIE